MGAVLPSPAKKAIKRTRFWPVGGRILTGKIRLLPTFIIIGGQKCGTTSLYNYLGEHPGIVPALEKEVHFFDANFKKGTTWYRAHFPTQVYRLYCRLFRKNIICGEATPYYIFHPRAPRLISEMLPDVKLIALLRNPVDRAYSHYQHMTRRGDEILSFEEAIRKEKERLDGEADKMLEDQNYQSSEHRLHSYLSRGIYADQLRAWENLLPKEQFLVLKSEDLFAEPSFVLQRVLKFLDLPYWEPKAYKPFKRGKYQRMDSTTRDELDRFFRPHNQRLYEYIGMKFNWEGE